MNRKFRLLFFAVAASLAVSCGKKPYDPAKDPNNGHGQAEVEYTIDKYGYATYEYKGFTFKFKQDVIATADAKKAISKIESDLDNITSLIPEAALKVMQKNPIWFEENNTHNTSAAWYHKWEGYPASIGDISAKGKCVEITNYKNYVSWTAMNQPLMVLHELCHLYHDQGLGGDNNQDINRAYNNAKNKGLYNTYYYRTSLTDQKGTAYTATDSQKAYCMTDNWEFFSEMCEAYWGENDYYPFNYAQLKEFDPVTFEVMEKIWGKRFE